MNDSPRKPADRHQTHQLRPPWFKIENSHCVLRGIAHIKSLPTAIKRERIGLRSEKISRILPRADSFDDFVSPSINDGKRITACVGYNHPSAIWRKSQSGGMQARENLGLGTSATLRQINNRHRTFV